MARIRTVKPGYFTDEDLADVSMPARLLGIALLCQADREGRLKDSPKKIQHEAMPWDGVDVSALLEELVRINYLIRYEVDGQRYIQVRNFTKHQVPHIKEASSTIPAPCKNSANHNPPRCQHPQEQEQEQEGVHGGPVEPPVVGSLSGAVHAAPTMRLQAAPKPTYAYSPEFEAFWLAYPPVRRTDKAKCFRLYKAALASGATDAEVMDGLTRWKASEDWRKEGGKYVCAPAVWLGAENRRWESPPMATLTGQDVPSLKQAPPEVADRPWLDAWLRYGGHGTGAASVMNFAAAVGVDPMTAAARFKAEGLAAAGDYVWQERAV